jgi:glucose-6-phosphate isomerase
VPALELEVDATAMIVDGAPLVAGEFADGMASALAAMDELEAGGTANPSEGRMVGHYWLRAPDLAPSPALREAIVATTDRVRSFAADVHAGRVAAPSGARFTHVLSMGIGGSALGPMFVAEALGDQRTDRMRMAFIDNTDPDGIDRCLADLGDDLARTMCLVISKSGGTPETRNALVLVSAAYERAGLDFAKHAVAVTGDGSRLDERASDESWIARFPMWDWVGGRTSETSAVGLLPAALQGLDVDGLLAGAAAMDEATRLHEEAANPAALLASAWLHAAKGRGARAMVVLPYKDSLLLFSRYLQQLVMESLGKASDLAGNAVSQGLTVYGNKGSTDQHAFVQQLRDGLDDFFVTFIRVLAFNADEEVDPGVTAGDYLHAFMLGTRAALSESRRPSLTITVPRVDARTVGGLIALFERAVGLYASLVGINAYDQPGVEAGKKAAAAILEAQSRLLQSLTDAPRSAAELSADAGTDEATVRALLEHLAANGRATTHANGRGWSSSASG